MTFYRMEELLDNLISLESTFRYFKMNKEYTMVIDLMQELGLKYDTDSTIEKRCIDILDKYSSLRERFYQEQK